MKMDLPLEKIKKIFPNLAKEIEKTPMKIQMDSVRIDVKIGESIAFKNFMGYNPDVIDFLRRCNTEAEAEDILDYLEKRGEISTKYAKQIRNQLKDKGIRSFGAKKEDNYYMRGRQKQKS